MQETENVMSGGKILPASIYQKTKSGDIIWQNEGRKNQDGDTGPVLNCRPEWIWDYYEEHFSTILKDGTQLALIESYEYETDVGEFGSTWLEIKRPDMKYTIKDDAGFFTDGHLHKAVNFIIGRKEKFNGLWIFLGMFIFGLVVTLHGIFLK